MIRAGFIFEHPNPLCPSDTHHSLRSGMLRDPPNTTMKIWDADSKVKSSDLGENFITQMRIQTKTGLWVKRSPFFDSRKDLTGFHKTTINENSCPRTGYDKPTSW